MRYYIKQMNIAEPNSWHVFDCQETDETGEHICKESDVSHKDAMKYRDSLEHDDFMLRAAELRENLVGGHPSSPQPLAPITDMTVGVDAADFGEWVAMVNYLALKDQNAEKDAEIAALQAEVASYKNAYHLWVDKNAELSIENHNMRLALKHIGDFSKDYYVLHQVSVGLGGNQPTAPSPEAVTPEAPSEVTLTADEIDWLATIAKIGVTHTWWFEVGKLEVPDSIIEKITPNGGGTWLFEDEYDTQVNRAAIEARRKELAQG